MMKLHRLLPLLLAFVACSSALSTRTVPCTLKNLYVDVVVAIDYSNNMNTSGILQAAADVSSIFSSSTISQKLGSFSRVAVVNYTSIGNTIYDLKYFNSTSELTNNMFNIVPQKTTEPNGLVSAGLYEAARTLNSGRQTGSRNNAQQAIIIGTSGYDFTVDTDAIDIANNLKVSGISIIVIDYSTGQTTNYVKDIASPNQLYKSNDPNLVAKVQAELCAVNSYCQSGWTQVTNQYPVGATPGGLTKYGECIMFDEVEALRSDAAVRCNQMGGYLVNEFDQMKHKFLYDFSNSKELFSVWMGLAANLTSGRWEWDQKDGPSIPLLPGDFTAWAPNNPSGQMDQNPDVRNSYYDSKDLTWDQSDVSAKRTDTVCQKNTCDTDNYCP